MGGCQDGTQTARLSFPIRQQAETAQANAGPEAGAYQSASSPAAVMLRPVPRGASPDPQNGPASTWAPVQRMSGEIPASAESDLVPVASLGRPLPPGVMTTTQAPTGDPLLPVPSSPTMAATAAEPADSSKVLPMPKVVPNGKKPVGVTGYPELAPTMITQPMDAPREFAMRALSTYIVEPPDILLVELFLPQLKRSTIRAEQLVRPDGTIGFGAFDKVFVAGLTLDQIKLELARTILPNIDSLKAREDFKEPDPKDKITMERLLLGLKVDVLRYNSKFYYVITDGGGYGEQVTSIPLTGNERVLDAVAKIQGLPTVASKKRIWVARATPHDYEHPQILPVDWTGIVQRGSASTNFQMFPGDRLYINSDPKIRLDSKLAKLLAPVERILGVTLLGSGVVNSIKNGGTGGNNTPK